MPRNRMSVNTASYVPLLNCQRASSPLEAGMTAYPLPAKTCSKFFLPIRSASTKRILRALLMIFPLRSRVVPSPDWKIGERPISS